MEAFTGSPLTLVVKAPNQEIGDQTVECFLDWTVQKLKKHLSAVYPTNPHERSQRIIYSGKLLQDNVLLKDVLTVNDTQEKCTVHLVCTPTTEELAKHKKEANKTWASQKRSTVLTANNSNGSSSSSSSDGLRHRTSASSLTSSHQASASGLSEQPQQAPYPSGFASSMSLPSTPGPVPVPHPGVVPTTSMSPQQLQWMQHMYAQQLYAQQLSYMQYASMMAAGGSGQPAWTPGYPMASPWLQPTTAHPTTTSSTPAQQNHHHHQQQQPIPAADNMAAPPPGAAPAPAANNQNPAQAPQMMNVGGGQPLDDDNEDGIRRDWLDWTFTLCRFGILLSIVYFYSSINRFLVVAGAMFLMYLYQAGFFQLRRRARNRPPVTPPQQPAPQQEDASDDGASEGNDSQPEDSESSSSGSDETDGNRAAELDEPPRPGVLATTWVFVSTFFTSIIPQGPGQQFPAN